jgi:UDP-N-acetylglucosamine 2-epimerase (non-hydrolysing)
VQERLGISGEYGVVTLHRAGNVDDRSRLAELLGTLEVVARRQPLYFPVHPRTRARMVSAGLAVPERVHLLEPLGYLEFLGLVAGSAVVLTDSGGIQEETTVLGVPCLTLRENTERPATVEHGTNVLAGTRRESILAAWAGVRWGRLGSLPAGWDGQAAGRVVLALRVFFEERAERQVLAA